MENSLVLRSCLSCGHHSLKDNGAGQNGFCAKENVFSLHTKCVLRRALDYFINRDRAGTHFLPAPAQP